MKVAKRGPRLTRRFDCILVHEISDGNFLLASNNKTQTRPSVNYAKEWHVH